MMGFTDMLFDYDFRNYSFRLLAYMTALSVIGILVVRSATNMDSEAVTKQMFGILAGMAIAVCLSLVDYHKDTEFQHGHLSDLHRKPSGRAVLGQIRQ